MTDYRRFQPCVRSFKVREEYDFVFDDKSYEIARTRRDITPWHDGSWEYAVHSVTYRERRFCDPDRPTHKRVVAAFLRTMERGL